MNNPRKERFIFCYWDDPLYENPKIKENENNNKTNRKKSSYKRKKS